MIIPDFFDAISVFSVPIKVHPSLNVLNGGKLNEKLHEIEPINMDDIKQDPNVVELNEPVVPKSSSVLATIAMAQSLQGGGNTLPQYYAWYSQHEYEVGTLVEKDDNLLQIDSLTDHNAMAGIFVYKLKGDVALEQSL